MSEKAIRATEANRIQSVREVLGLSRAAMAKVLRCEAEHIVLLEAGEMQLDKERIAILRKRYCVNEGFLHGEDARMFDRDSVDGEPDGNCDVVTTLVLRALSEGRDITEGEPVSPISSKQVRINHEEAFRERVKGFAGDDQDMFDEIVDSANMLQGAVEMERFEEGLRYGARLVFNLLAGKRGHYAV